MALRAWWTGGELSWSRLSSLLRGFWEREGPFDVVAGFSQGALLAHLVAASSEPPFCSLRGALFFSGFDGGTTLVPRPELASLHVYSDTDSAVPPAESRSLAQRYTAPRTHTHRAGHAVPQKSVDLDAVTAFLDSLLPPPPPPPPPPRAPPRLAAEQGPYEVSEAQQEELQALCAIFGEEEFELVQSNPPRFRLRLAWHPLPGEEGEKGAPWLFLCFTFSPAYLASPAAQPAVRIDTAERGQLGPELRASLLKAVQAGMAEAAEGAPRCFDAATRAREWAEAAVSQGPPPGGGGAAEAAADCAADAESGDESEDDSAQSKWWEEEEMDAAEVAAAAAAAARAEASPGAGVQGREAGAAAHAKAWRFMVGLVGKPSAGKSTFFNAACRPTTDAATAKCAAHPFTTIEPNLGFAYVAAPCPCARLGLSASCSPAHGKPGLPGCTRRLPILVKDVAGLVPGAWQGRGRGNAFLDAVVDCDALIHVVDASGSLDSEGQPGEGNPLHDVAWVRAELHAWVFANVRGKFGNLRKRAQPRHAGADPDAAMARLCALLSGYRVTRPMVVQAMSRSGLDPGRLTDPHSGIPAWTSAQLHCLVANVLRVRFPVLCALNKTDLPAATAFVERLRAEMPHEPMEPVSAAAEWWLAKQAAQVEYSEGAETVTARDPGADIVPKLELLKKNVFEPWGGTGVLRALSRAVGLRHPVYVYPVVDLGTCEAPARRVAARGALAPSHMAAPESEEEEEEEVAESDESEEEAEAPGGRVLRECLLIRPQTTVAELFSALGREGLAANEFIRAERLAESGASAVMRKEEPLAPGVLVIRIATNRRCAWQANVEGRRIVKGGPKKGAGGAAPPPKVAPLEGKSEVFRFQRRKSNFSNQ